MKPNPGDHITYRRRLAWAKLEKGTVISVVEGGRVDRYCVKPDEHPTIRATIVYKHEIVKDKGE